MADDLLDPSLGLFSEPVCSDYIIIEAVLQVWVLESKHDGFHIVVWLLVDYWYILAIIHLCVAMWTVPSYSTAMVCHVVCKYCKKKLFIYYKGTESDNSDSKKLVSVAAMFPEL